MLFREIIAVFSEIHTKRTNTLCGQNVGLLNVKLAVRIVTTGPYTVEYRPVSHVKLCRFRWWLPFCWSSAVCSQSRHLTEVSVLNARIILK